MTRFLFQPKHDVPKHTENILTGLPSHMANQDQKKIIQDTVDLTIGSRETKGTKGAP